MEKLKVRLGLILFVLVFAGIGCAGKTSPRTVEGYSHRIEVPSVKARIPLKLNYRALPEGARAHLPAFDGEKFFVTLPERDQISISSKQIFKNVIIPILDSMGFEREEKSISLPPSKGVKMPVANFKGLAQDTALEYQKRQLSLRPKTQGILDTFLGKNVVSPKINRALERGEGMNFNQLVASVERQKIQYTFHQVVNAVPIEHTLLLATRWEGKSVTSVRGVVFNQFKITNKNKFVTPQAVVKAAFKALGKVRGVKKITSKTDGPHLVLLPYGSDSTGKTILRYSYRMILHTVFQKEEGAFLLWLDADKGEILKLEPLFDNATAAGMEYLRDPGTGQVFKGVFKVDAPTGGEFILQKRGFSNRVDYLGDGDPSNDLSIPDNTNGSHSFLANFDQSPINDAAEALCASGSNKGFQQVNFFSSLHYYSKHMFNLGIFMPFPKFGGTSTDAPDPFNPQIDVPNYCNAHSSMKFGACDGYHGPSCPDVSWLNFAHDKTVVAHELGHNITPRLTSGRPSDWCLTGTCAIPLGWFGVHDLADAWADYFESTNCTGGWAFKNQGGVDNSLYCANWHSEFGGGPRLHEVSIPFDPTKPGDHFPEKPSGDLYGNNQIAATALWHIRLGMHSKSSLFGTFQYGLHLTRALKNTGFMGTANGAYYDGVYKFLYDLELEMVNEWANSGSAGTSSAQPHMGAHTTNKVPAGFARTGIFLIPISCIDGDPATGEGWICPVSEGGENGGDAVIDILDNEPSDDGTINGVVHPEEDYLELGGRQPTFQVWTGPRYRMDGANRDATFKNPAPCNSMFQVEVSTDQNFVASRTIYSSWFDVDTDPTTPESPECFGTWTPKAEDWNALQSNGALSLIYYRARTKNSVGDNERISTEPGKIRTVPPSYAVLTVDGQREY